MTLPPKLFDYKRKRAIELRAQAIEARDADFLACRVMEDIELRLQATNREFQNGIDLFSPSKNIIQAIEKTGKVGSVSTNYPDNPHERDILGLQPQSLELIISIFGLHWLNDLPGALLQINNALRPDGLFMGALPGEGTLKELRDCLLIAETEISGGATMRVDPFVEIRQVGNLLQRAGFTLPVVDVEEITVRYRDMFALIKDLRAMGATSALVQNRSTSPRNLFSRANEIYAEKYADDDGKIRATFRIIHLSGWREHESQQKPQKRGSAKTSLADFLQGGSE